MGITDYNYLNNVPGLELHVKDYFMELPMLAELFKALQTSDAFSEYEWLIFSRENHSDELQRALHPQRTILIYIGNEDGYLPPWISQVYRIFTPDMAVWPAPPGVHLIPLGPHGDTPELPVLPWSDRSLDVFFAGQVIKNRSGFIMQSIELLYTLKQHPHFNAEIHLSPHFRHGLSPSEFAHRLMKCRIALVPHGLSPITLRLFEAMRSGCVLFTGQLPPFWFLKDLPRVAFDIHWEGLPQTSLNLLHNPQQLEALHHATRKHYLQACTPQAVSDYILNAL